MTWLLLTHLVIGIAVMAFGSRLGRRGALVGAVAPAATLVWLATRLPDVLDGRVLDTRQPWMPELGLYLDLRLDGFAAIMLLLIAGIGVLIFLYAAQYLAKRGAGVGRLCGLLTLFAGAMVGLVLADNLLLLYGFWELTSITSFLLIGNDHERADARAASLHALLVTSLGGLAMFAGFLILGNEAGTYRISEIVDQPPTGTAVGVALALILLGAFTKSAQYPFHAWLPGAMVAPTPVSAYLHSATMVKAGVYLIARLSPAFAVEVGWWRPVVMGVGLATMVFGGLRALRQHDLKVLLAHGTVSQLGFMVAIFGLGTPEAEVAGAVLLLAHGAFKATGFMVVGILDHQFGTRDLRCIPSLDRSWAPVAVASVVGAASMAGIPLAFGFVAKEAVLQAVVDYHVGWWGLVLAAMVAGSALTVAYSARFAWGSLGRDATEPYDLAPAAVRPSWRFVAPAGVLTVVTLALGLRPGLADRLLRAAEAALTPEPGEVHLAIWHGVNLALVMSGVAIASGLVIFAIRRQVSPVLALGRHLPEAGDAYQSTLRGLNRLADRVTSVAQPGSLPIYAGVILFTASVGPLWMLIDGGGGWPGWPDWVDTPAHIPVVGVLVGSAIAASAVRRRFTAALFLGVAGYAMAALFVLQGAPDLALTQAAIETLTTVLFVLVLRRLPDRFSWAGGRGNAISGGGDDPLIYDPEAGPVDSEMGARRRAIRIAVSASVAAVAFVMAIVMGGPDPSTPASDEMVERALPDGQGRNVVNVTLVDFRGVDTLGEITVLASAAIGTVALARAGRGPRGRRGTATTSGPVPDRKSVV